MSNPGTEVHIFFITEPSLPALIVIIIIFVRAREMARLRIIATAAKQNDNYDDSVYLLPR